MLFLGILKIQMSWIHTFFLIFSSLLLQKRPRIKILAPNFDGKYSIFLILKIQINFHGTKTRFWATFTKFCRLNVYFLLHSLLQKHQNQGCLLLISVAKIWTAFVFYVFIDFFPLYWRHWVFHVFSTFPHVLETWFAPCPVKKK